MSVKVRSLFAAHQLILARDPETGITYQKLLRFAKSGVLPAIRDGKNFYVNLAALEQVLGMEEGELTQ